MTKRRHGTMIGYSADKCRCRACRKAWAEYMAEYKQRRRAGESGRDVTAQVERELEHTQRELEKLAQDGTAPKIPVRLSPLALQILYEHQRKTGDARSEIIDRLIRDHAEELAAIE
jgi:hypothetical protein